LIACGGLVAVVCAAYGAGCEHADYLIPYSALAAVALSVAAMVRPQAAERFAGGALLAWVVLATLTDQFAFVVSTSYGVLVAAAWLVPPVVGGVALPTAGYWLSGFGCWAAAFAGVAATSSSAHSTSHGAGLFFGWVS
jgi:hypothetical protein